ncbi:peptide deformylase, mitochondrial-like [Anastrepha obliqua]|uniref:peptide deformylase, mitochondrial-like n=1 Tax=Anastrepha obliqua TaxID=95512 RepID=UPI002409C0F4|nr:peptide deformylase, mitochondrial-like [Anastrepha obliqua]
MMQFQRLPAFALKISNQAGRFVCTSSSRAKSFRKMYQEVFTPNLVNKPPYEHFVQVGDPILRTKAAEVPEELVNSKEVNLIAEKMVKVLRKFDCVGVAAPQIGVSLRIIVMEFSEGLKDHFSKSIYEARKMCTLPLTVLINPVLSVTNYDKHKHHEGCMSVRGFSAEVERYDSILIKGTTLEGVEKEMQLSGWNARIAQHEMDHLDGKLYIDHMDRATFTCTCWETVNTKGGRVEIPFYK